MEIVDDDQHSLFRGKAEQRTHHTVQRKAISAVHAGIKSLFSFPERRYRPAQFVQVVVRQTLRQIRERAAGQQLCERFEGYILVESAACPGENGHSPAVGLFDELAKQASLAHTRVAADLDDAALRRHGRVKRGEELPPLSVADVDVPSLLALVVAGHESPSSRRTVAVGYLILPNVSGKKR
jgi:hypothetical protein